MPDPTLSLSAEQLFRIRRLGVARGEIQAMCDEIETLRTTLAAEIERRGFAETVMAQLRARLANVGDPIKNVWEIEFQAWAADNENYVLVVPSEDYSRVASQYCEFTTQLRATKARAETAERALGEAKRIIEAQAKDICESGYEQNRLRAELAKLRAPVGELIDLADRVKYEPIEQIAEHYYAAAMILAARSREISDNYQQKVEWCERLCAQVRERDARIAALELNDELLRFLIDKKVIVLESERMVDRDPHTRCSWVKHGERTAVDISNAHHDAALAQPARGEVSK